MAKLKTNDFLSFILFSQLIVYVTTFLDVPVVRQVFGVFYFTFIPGFVIIKLLKLNGIDFLEKLLFSVGLSVAFLMFAGLSINELGPFFGISEPLSMMPLIVFLNSLVLACAFLAYWRGEDIKIWDKLPRVSPLMLLFTVLLILAIAGTMCVNVYGNNSLLLFMMAAISLLFIFGVLSKKSLPSKLYPFAVLMIAIALLYHSSFISNYFVTLNSDITGEYFAFKVTQSSAHWSSVNPYLGGGWPGYDRLNAMLSVTILPTLYSSLLNMDTIWMFKIVFPLIFSLVPLGLYQVWQLYVGKKYAFISAFLFMAEMTFYTEMLRLDRQMIAELFFVLLLLVIVNRKIKSTNKMIFFMIFSFALVTSHYGVAEIFLIFISIPLISLIILKRPSKKVTVSMVVLFFVIMFSWYIYTSRSAVFDSFLEFGDNVYRQLGDFFSLQARGETVLKGLGLEAPPTIWNTISRVFAYLTEALIGLGFLGVITKRVKVPFDVEYFAFTILSVGFLAALILVPGLAGTMNMTRFYHVLLFFLAPLCVLGAETIVGIIRKWNMEVKGSILLLIVLVPYFLFQTGVVYEVTGNDSWSVPLSGYRIRVLKLYSELGYSDASCVFGARWLSNNLVIGNTKVYTCYYARSDLRGYGLIYMGYIEVLSNVTEVAANGTVYLRPLNTIEDVVVGDRYSWNASELHFLYDLNKIYSNGGSEVYKNKP